MKLDLNPDIKADLFYYTEQYRNAILGVEGTFDLNKLARQYENPFFFSAEAFAKIFTRGNSPYLLIQTSRDNALLFHNPLHTFSIYMDVFKAELYFADYYLKKGKYRYPRALNRFQEGSARDDFNFGKFILVKRDVLNEFIEKEIMQTKFSAFYDFILFVSRNYKIARIPDFICIARETDRRKSGEKIFDYVKKEFAEIQKEREKVFTEHLIKIGAYLPPRTATVKFELEKFPVTASVIIPVKNRVNTIRDAIESALEQKTDFDFNIIVVDNHSTDGTTNVIRKIAKENEKVIHLIPKETNLGIGGCWNLAVNDERCGAFAVQLDSDDLYSSENTLQKIIDKFFETNVAAVVGSYTVTNFSLKPIPPGVVSHDEWTDENGHNNALRLNGFGAPRAYYTSIIREHTFLNISYGEDYIMMLYITRNYKIARIYESLYFARRWKGNSDANLRWNEKNDFDCLKDGYRTAEIQIRREMNSKKDVGEKE